MDSAASDAKQRLTKNQKRRMKKKEKRQTKGDGGDENVDMNAQGDEQQVRGSATSALATVCGRSPVTPGPRWHPVGCKGQPTC